MTVTMGHLTFDHVLYDARGDVLYLSVGEPRAAADSLKTNEGHVLRFDEAGEVIGLTLINPKWLAERDGQVSVSLPIPAADLELALA